MVLEELNHLLNSLVFENNSGIPTAFSMKKFVEGGEGAVGPAARPDLQGLSNNSLKELLVLIGPRGACFDPLRDGEGTPFDGFMRAHAEVCALNVAVARILGADGVFPCKIAAVGLSWLWAGEEEALPSSHSSFLIISFKTNMLTLPKMTFCAF